MQSLNEFYGNFGPDAVREIALHLKRHGNLVPLLEKFGLNVPANLPDQHRVLREFIFTYGVTFFLTAIRENMTREQIIRRKVEQLVSHSHSLHVESVSLGHVPLESVPRKADQPNGTTPVTPLFIAVPIVAPEAPAASAVQPPAPPAPVQSPAPAPTPAPPPVPSGSARGASTLRLRPFILMPSYKGPDRRLNGDRRNVGGQAPASGERRRLARRANDAPAVGGSNRRTGDRRLRTDVIFFANRRFGGDRRGKTSAGRS